GIGSGRAAHVHVVDGVVGGVLRLQDLRDGGLAVGRVLHVAAPVVGVDEEVGVQVVGVVPIDQFLGPAAHAVSHVVGVLFGIVGIDGAVGGVVVGRDHHVVGDVRGLQLEAQLGVS